MTLTVDGALSLLTRLQQCASGRLPSDEDTTPVSICDERPRLELLREVLEEYNVPSAQAIIWARFTFEVDEICEMLTKLKIPFGRYDGEVTPDDRALAKERFQSGEYRVLVAKVQAAGVGLTLTAASLLVYYSNLFALSLREQSEDRAHRKGQEQTVTIVDLVAVGTVDERILEVLLTKRAVSEQVTDPKWWLASS
jgi:SNF2 family DNA or RNA helicase